MMVDGVVILKPPAAIISQLAALTSEYSSPVINISNASVSI